MRISDWISYVCSSDLAFLEYTLVMKRIIDSAKEPGFDESSWGPLAGLVDRDAFIRVGPFKDEMTWPEYVAFLTGWAPRRHWECSFRRITEQRSEEHKSDLKALMHISYAVFCLKNKTKKV